jgi:ABC-type uncharacterized transport system permease subunit
MALSRLPRFRTSKRTLLLSAFAAGTGALLWHGRTLESVILMPDGLHLSLANTASFIGLQLALIALLGAAEAQLRGLAGGLLLLAGVAAAVTGLQAPPPMSLLSSWQLQAHILISLFAYGLLTVGTIVALYALIQERRLRAGRLSSINHLFAPLETTERLLFGITATGFAALLLAVLSGFLFVENLFAQHLVHKTALSLLALLVFGVLLAGRQFAGWRGRAAVSLYLWGFAILGLAYFGTRFVLENILGRTWG